jgi:hypothetical protein
MQQGEDKEKARAYRHRTSRSRRFYIAYFGFISRSRVPKAPHILPKKKTESLPAETFPTLEFLSKANIRLANAFPSITLARTNVIKAADHGHIPFLLPHSPCRAR